MDIHLKLRPSSEFALFKRNSELGVFRLGKELYEMVVYAPVSIISRKI
jgi:hypothetical protein